LVNKDYAIKDILYKTAIPFLTLPQGLFTLPNLSQMATNKRLKQIGSYDYIEPTLKGLNLCEPHRVFYKGNKQIVGEDDPECSNNRIDNRDLEGP